MGAFLLESTVHQPYSDFILHVHEYNIIMDL